MADTILVTGGTGSFGHAFLTYALAQGVQEFRVLSRDEFKQEVMRKELHDSRVKYYVGDVRDRASVDRAMEGVEHVFHAAALKEVPSCEFFPIQAVMTNALGSSNVIESAIAHGVKSVVCLSTDKAATLVSSRSVPASPMVVLYTGSVGWVQLDAILDMIAAVRDMVGIEFHVYSHQSQDELAVMGVRGNRVVLHQGLAEDEVRRCQVAADVLYLPISFRGKGRHIIETAQPANSVEYMASGVPVLIHAPAYAFVTRYAREHDIAIVVDQPGSEELIRVLMALISDRTDAQKKAARAAALASKSYDSLEISRLLQSYLLHERV